MMSLRVCWALLISSSVIYMSHFGWEVLAPICTAWSLGLVIADKMRESS